MRILKLNILTDSALTNIVDYHTSKVRKMMVEEIKLLLAENYYLKVLVNSDKHLSETLRKRAIPSTRKDLRGTNPNPSQSDAK